MATLAQEMLTGMAALHGSVRTTRGTETSRYLFTKPLNDFGLVMDVAATYWFDDDGRVETEVTGIAYRSADCRHEQDMPLAMFSEDALRELRDEIAGEIECEQDDMWLSKED
jgi:hypothetical protein